MFRILAINPGSTTTKIGIFEDEKSVSVKNIEHDPRLFEKMERIMEEIKIRKKDIVNFLDESGFSVGDFDAFAARGGILPPLESGTYVVNEEMDQYLRYSSPVDHASNLAAVIAYEFSKETGKPSYITDPISVDEFETFASFSGFRDIERKSLLHALNMKAVARKVAGEIGKPYEDCHFVIAHLGGGISIGAQKKGRMVDVNNANDEGPFSPERSGELPTGEVVKMSYSGEYDKQQLKRMFTKNAGLKAYLNTNDLRKAFEMAENDKHAAEVIEAMAYQIAKEVGGMCAVLHGEVDSIILTGGLAHSLRFVEMIKGYISSYALVAVVPGENELEALATGSLRVLRGEETPRTFSFQEVDVQ